MHLPEHCHELTLCDTLKTLLSSHPQWHCFGLIDGIEPSPLLEQFLLLHPEAGYQPLFLGTEYEPCLPASPYLVEIDPVDSDFMVHWGSQASHDAIWFVSAFSLDAQWQFWRSLITVRTEEDDNVLFRFWRGEILGACLSVCSDHERSQLMSPCRVLFAPDGNRQWRVFTNPSPAESLAPPALPWWQFRSTHLQPFARAFDRILVDEIEDVLWRTQPEQLARFYPAIIPNLIDQGVQQAKQLGLQQDRSLSAFVQCQFRWNAGFWQEPILNDLWQQEQNTDIAFLNWCTAIAPPLQLD